ncbi:Dehydrogenase (flavoprotein) [Sphingomonas gellani]|uniref:Dehydrogenase (Flavoprotein) n=1 Tax=Sphingomonas gellani TaxID=1166340 RepID=A0A1H8GTY9_9SPHN|nr:FAD-dependent monooxygenase [Sphingomonas gellani]SEN46728.1 Dehydrogenase (flavoprotein) [Sphingomonas gellani]
MTSASGAPLIVGGGPAGASAAISLARAGLAPLIVERTREPADALCGGFLSWRTLASLEKLGVATDELNPAPVTRMRLFAGERSRDLPLPAPARAVSRRRLDALLLARAEAAGARVERGVTAREVIGRTVRFADGGTASGSALFFATGKHDVRGLARPPAASGGDPAIGLRLRLSPHPALSRLVGDAIELHLLDRGYAGLVLQEDGGGNLCCAVRRSRLRGAGSPAALLSAMAREIPALGERIGHADLATDTIDATANVPYGWRAREGAEGVFRLGDQAAVIPSLAGEGMGIAIASGTLAAAALLAGGPDAAPQYQRHLSRRAARPLAIAGAAWRLAETPVLARATVSAFPAAMISLLARATRIG